MLVLPWLSLPLVGSKAFKRFLPATVSIMVYLIGECMVAEKEKWWWFHFHNIPNFLGVFPLLFGPFFAGSLWILKLTYGNFTRFFITNLIIDSFFTYVLLDWFKKIGYMSIVKMTKLQMSITFLIESSLLYGFQMFFDKWASRKKFIFRFR
jgi:hypothetical protein